MFLYLWIIHGDLTKDLFGKTESRSSPPFLKGTDVLNSLRDFENVFGNKKKRSNDGPRKKGQFFLNYLTGSITCYVTTLM